MRISVIMPVYNAEKYLRFSVGSVIEAAKRFEGETELICVDDGSTDSSGTILDRYADADRSPRQRMHICVIHQSNGGEGAARNAGMGAATGDLIAFLDADDVYHPETLAAVAAVRAAKGAEVIRLGWRNVPEHGTPSPDYPGESCWRKIDFATREKSSIFISCLGSATVVDRRIAKQLRWSDLSQGEDLIFTMRCFARAKGRWLVDFPLVDYLVRPDSISHEIGTSLVCGTCAYIPLVAGYCAELKEGPRAAADTRAYLNGLIWRRLIDAEKKFSNPEERALVRAAVWKMLRLLVEQDRLFTSWQRRVVRRASSCESRLILKALVALPWRLFGRRAG